MACIRASMTKQNKSEISIETKWLKKSGIKYTTVSLSNSPCPVVVNQETAIQVIFCGNNGNVSVDLSEDSVRQLIHELKGAINLDK